MIPAVSSTSAASTSTAASRQTSEEAGRSPFDAELSSASSVLERESAVVTISPEAALQAAKPTQPSVVSQQAAAAAASVSPAASSAAPVTDSLETPAAAVQAQQAQQTPTKPDWVYLPNDLNKDGKVTVFEQQAYDFRHYPSSLEKAEAYKQAFSQTKPEISA